MEFAKKCLETAAKPPKTQENVIFSATGPKGPGQSVTICISMGKNLKSAAKPNLNNTTIKKEV
jgi:hypothetical protein